ncbi:MAG: hypothetical protein CL874_05790 [Dehalococcoidales bacterium]|jgi:hypothetical protein|nr:hypothetical protein [Dehalococcoidales bacterium]MDP6577048.1 metal-dependent hydrolase [Dehalococcoidales bacterium]|tara:strand:- start:346 stop:999 length:654 start_codon:yes stop_codon:yes gene_type:complete
MLVLGHAGITLGAAVLLSGALSRNSYSIYGAGKRQGQPGASGGLLPSRDRTAFNSPSWTTFLSRYMHPRLLLISSLLPDIIDKPIGVFFLRETLSNGRIFCHTFLFLVLLTLTAIYLYRRYGETRLFPLSFGTSTHLVFDQMWHTPQTLFWPVLGLTFDKLEFTTFTSWISYLVHNLLAYPDVFIPELIGAVIIIGFTGILVRRRSVRTFIRYGQIR